MSEAKVTISSQPNISFASGSFATTTTIFTPKIVGYWVVGGHLAFAVTKKPSRWQKLNHKLWLGWGWRDA